MHHLAGIFLLASFSLIHMPAKRLFDFPGAPSNPLESVCRVPLKCIGDKNKLKCLNNLNLAR